jgi:putative flippase GtrA
VSPSFAAMRLELQRPETAFAGARFLMVGLVGLLTDATVYTVCSQAGLPDAAARAISLAAATAVTWLLNRAFTFGASPRSALAESLRYALVALGAQGFNYLLFLGLRAAVPPAPALYCLATSAACAAVLSFLGQRFYTFGDALFGSALRRRPADA